VVGDGATIDAGATVQGPATIDTGAVVGDDDTR
jgi:acetyltransferase-like isoleucine patch superfamily enzyme